MIITGLECPLDGLVLTPDCTGEVLQGNIRDRTEGKHMHIRITGTVSCVNAHKWIVSGELELARTR